MNSPTNDLKHGFHGAAASAECGGLRTEPGSGYSARGTRRSVLAAVLGVAGLFWLSAAAAPQEAPHTGWAPLAESDPRIEAIELDAPRPFGVLVGDRVRHEMTLTVPVRLRLQQSTLPSTRRIGDWLDLQRVELREGQAGDLKKYRITLNYQIFHTPLGVEVRTIPGFTLRFAGSGGGFPVTIPAWSFSMSPLLDRTVADEGENIVPMRPDRPPLLIDTRPYLLGLTVFGALSLLVLIWLAYAFGLFGRRAKGPFASARRRLRHLRRRPLDEQRLREGFRTVHRAFDQTAGRALFASQLERFFDHHPRFAGQREAIERFFDESRRLFFGAGHKAQEPPARKEEWGRIESLCRECFAAERGIA